MSSRSLKPLDLSLLRRPVSLCGASPARLSFSASCLGCSRRAGGAAPRTVLRAGRRKRFDRGVPSASNVGSGPESVATSADSDEEDPESAQLFEDFTLSLDLDKPDSKAQWLDRLLPSLMQGGKSKEVYDIYRNIRL